VGQAQPKHKGKISRVLAAKCALSVRVDALGDTTGATIGYESRLKVEERMRQLEGKVVSREEVHASAKQKQPPVQMYANGDASRGYSSAADSTLVAAAAASSGDNKKKRKADDGEGGEKKKRKEKVEEDSEASEKKKKKEKKDKKTEADSGEKKKKKKDEADDGDAKAKKKAKKAKA